MVESGTHHINRQDADWPPQSQGLATLGNAEWGGLTSQGVMIPRDHANKVNEEPVLDAEMLDSVSETPVVCR